MATYDNGVYYPNRGYNTSPTIDIIHIVDGRFIHPSDIDEISTKPFNTEDGMVDVLRGDTNENRLYIKLRDGTFASIDTDDEFNLKRTGHSTYDAKHRMTEVLINTWMLWKFDKMVE